MHRTWNRPSRRAFAKLFALSVVLLGAPACGDDDDDGSEDAAVDAGPIGAVNARIYATVSKTDEVLVIDDATHEQLRSYKVGKGPAIILNTPDFGKLYTANWADDSVSVINTQTHEVTNIALPARPYVIAMDPGGRYVYAGLSNNQIDVINTSTDTVERSLPTEELPASIIVSVDGKMLYVAYLGLGIVPGKLLAIDPVTGESEWPAVPVGLSPAWITIGTDGTFVYTLNFLSDDVTPVNVATWKAEPGISTGEGSQGIIGNVTPDGSRLYVTNHGSADMVAIDTKTRAIVQTIKLPGRPVGVQFSPDGKRVYVTDFGPQSLNEPVQLGYLLTGNYTATGNGQVSVYSTETGLQLGNSIPTGPGPTSVVVSKPMP